MKNTILSIFSAWVILLIFACQAVNTNIPVATTVTLSNDEVVIRHLFSKMETAWNNKDLIGYLHSFCEDAEIMEGYRAPVMTSKAEYSKLLPLKFSQVGPVKFEKIKIGGTTDFATNVRVTAFYPHLLQGGTVYFALNIVKIKGEWLIKKQTYTY